MKRGRVTDPPLRNALFYSRADIAITYHLTNTKKWVINNNYEGGQIACV